MTFSQKFAPVKISRYTVYQLYSLLFSKKKPNNVHVTCTPVCLTDTHLRISAASFIQVSLGSSDTLFMWIDRARPQLMGHVFVNPVDKDAYMAMLWYVVCRM